jgi:prepilin-type N-terminal cleavage/methylation domain-containing protein
MTKNKAFTLIELLVVTIIIAMLASLSLYAVNSAYRSAKETKTQGTIMKLHSALLDIYEGYDEKFEQIIDRYSSTPPPETTPDAQKARVKLHLIHDLMRLELPDCQADVITPPLQSNNYGGLRYQLKSKPEVCQYYPAGNADSSELLYAIILNLNPEALEGFGASEVGQGRNGLPCFLDAWGNPIKFIRCAPSAVSDLQQVEDGDPFDPGGLAGTTWFTFPLIYSAGPDEDTSDENYGFLHDKTAPSGDQTEAPFVDSKKRNGETILPNAHDNISNHVRQ